MPATMETTRGGDGRAVGWWMALFVAGWLALLLWAGWTGALLALPRPSIAALVALSILLPTAAYAASADMRRWFEAIGHRPLMLLHIWRIPAALVFFWYGAKGELPPLFWILAGTGDLLVGSYALFLAGRPQTPSNTLSFHAFGMADFVVAVCTGLAFTLFTADPRMATIATLPMALIPLFGVGLSGFTHLVAFDMLRRGVGFAPPVEGLGVAGSGLSGPDR